jgi:hypothetical protein
MSNAYTMNLRETQHRIKLPDELNRFRQGFGSELKAFAALDIPAPNYSDVLPGLTSGSLKAVLKMEFQTKTEVTLRR